MSATSNLTENSNLDIGCKLEKLVPTNQMTKQKPKRIRSRPGKTPAVQINWTEEEVS